MATTQEYAEKAKTQIDQLAREIDRLQEKADEMRTSLRAEYERKFQEISSEYERQIEELRRAKSDAEEKLSRMSAASGSAVDELRVGADAAIAEMKQAILRAKEKFMEKQ